MWAQHCFVQKKFWVHHGFSLAIWCFLLMVLLLLLLLWKLDVLPKKFVCENLLSICENKLSESMWSYFVEMSKSEVFIIPTWNLNVKFIIFEEIPFLTQTQYSLPTLCHTCVSPFSLKKRPLIIELKFSIPVVYYNIIHLKFEFWHLK